MDIVKILMFSKKEVGIMSTVINVGINLRDFNKGMQQVRGGLTDLGGMVGKAFAAVKGATIAVGLASLRAGEDANQALGVIASQTGQTEGEMRGLDRTIRDLAITQGRFTAQEMRESLGAVARNGQDADHQMRMLAAGMRSADASGNNLESSLYKLDKLMIKFGTEVEDVSKWVNVLAVAQQEMGISQKDMVDGMQRAAGIAQAAGLEYNFVAAALSIAEQNGMTMQTAATGLTGVFNQMLDPTSNIREAMTKLGVQTIRNADGTTNAQASFTGFIEQLKSAEPTMREQIMNTMGLTGSNLDLFTNLLNNQDALYDLAGMYSYAMKAGDEYSRVTQMADDRTGGFTERLRQARSIGREFLYSINDIIGARIYEWLIEATEELKNFLTQAKENGYIDMMAEAVMKVVEALMEIIKTITPVVIEWLPRLAEWTANVTKVLADNVEVVLGLWAAYKGYKIVSSVIGIFGGLKTAAMALKGKQAIGGLSPAMKLAVGTNGGGGLLGGASKMLAALGPKGWAILGIGVGATAAIGWFRQTNEDGVSNWSRMTTSIGNHASNLRDNVTDRIGDMARNGISRFQEFAGLSDDEMRQARENVVNAATTMRDNVTERFGTMRDNVTNHMTTLGNNARTKFENSRIAEVATTITSEIRSRFQEAGKQASSWGSAIGSGVRNGIESMRGAISNTVSSIGNAIGNTFRSVMGINSPSRVMTDLGYFTGKGVEVGLLGTSDMIKNASKELGEISIDGLTSSKFKMNNPINQKTHVDNSGNNTSAQRTNHSVPITIYNTYEIYNDIDAELINREQEQMIRDVLRSSGEGRV